MVLLPCEGSYDGYEDKLFIKGSKSRLQLEDEWDYDAEMDAAEAALESYADRLHDEIQCGDITEGQASNRFARVRKKSFNRR